MNLKVGGKHGGPNHLRARFLDQIWGKILQRYARLLGHEKGKQSLEGGSRMDPGEGSGKQSYTMCVYIYIYRYVQYTFD